MAGRSTESLGVIEQSMKIARYGLLGIGATVAFWLIAMAAFPESWLSAMFIGPGYLVAAGVTAAAQAVLPQSTLDALSNMVEGRAAFVALMLLTSFTFWSIAIPWAIWWVRSAPEQ